MTHAIDLTVGKSGAGANGRLLGALFAALRARAERARQEAAVRRTLRLLEALDADQLRDIGLRRGNFREALRVDPRA